MRPIAEMTTSEIEEELNRLGLAEQWGDRMDDLEAELRSRYGVTDAARAVVTGE